MYLSICKKKYKNFEVSDLFDTYQKPNYAFIRPKGTESNFISIPFQEYVSYFTRFNDFIFLPVQETIYRGIFRKKAIKQEKELHFKFEYLDFEYLLAMQLPIIDKINMLSKIDGFASHTESIHKSLVDLKSSIDMPFYDDRNLNQKIDHIASLVTEAQNALRKDKSNIS